MRKLKAIGKSVYGTRYSFNGSIPFNSFNVSELKFGDIIMDNDGNGMPLFVNNCSCCEGKYLAGMLYSDEDCNNCKRYKREIAIIDRWDH